MSFTFIENFFPENYYSKITDAHQFYNLQESSKESFAFRKGVYLSEVTPTSYHLLRCSTNLGGPTENFADCDREIIAMVNAESKKHFTDSANVNHVLAQLYINHRIDGKNKKAKISEHSDKTKDMPKNGLIAFCSFYNDEQNNNHTKMRFRCKLTNEKIEYTLSPRSLLLIDLATNARYTHEIIPPPGEVESLPIRLGYVIRSSNTIATYNDIGTFINGTMLHDGTEEEIAQLKNLYYRENVEPEIVEYPQIYFSMNRGDYLPPRL